MKALFIGCHCDDLELGCGGTIHKHRNDWDIHCAVLCQRGYKDKELYCLKEIATRSFQNLGVKKFSFADFKPDEFINQRQKIWDYLNLLRLSISPDVVFIHSADDHPDHKLLNQEGIRVFRTQTLIAYHINRSKQTFEADTFEELNSEDLQAKLTSAEIYRDFYSDKIYLEADAIRSQLVVNGIYPGLKFAEMFKTIKRIGI